MCEFCEIYQQAKESEKIAGLKNNYYAILRERSIVNGREKGELDHSPVKIHYCPECGRKLTEGME